MNNFSASFKLDFVSKNMNRLYLHKYSPKFISEGNHFPPVPRTIPTFRKKRIVISCRLTSPRNRKFKEIHPPTQLKL